MVPYAEWEIPVKILDKYRKARAASKISAYIEENGHEPSNLTPFFVLTDEELEIIKRRSYARQEAKEYVPPVRNVGDILYYKDGILDAVPYTTWDDSLGTPVAVCAIPTAHDVYGDGKAGWIAVNAVNLDGSHATEDATFGWIKPTVSMDAFENVVNWNNDGSSTVYASSASMLPSDYVTDSSMPVCKGDEGARYADYSYWTPSPYLNGERNPSYYATLEGGNAFSDFNGKANTEKLASIESDNCPAKACLLYSDNELPAGSWYMPSTGEFGYIIARFAVINNALSACGKVPLITTSAEWYLTSTHPGNANMWCARTKVGAVTQHSSYGHYCRPFLAY